MGLTVLCAGCPKGEREEIEGTVKSILGPRSASGSWLVSLVKVRDHWSVTLEGPGVKAKSFSAPASGLREAIADALGGGERPASHATAPPAGAPSVAGPPAAGSQARRDRHECARCKRPFEVVYEAVAEESQETVPVACPHCWQSNPILVAEGAATTGDFRALKLQ